MLLAKGRITKDLITMLFHWRHSGFQVLCGQRIFPQDETAMENLARYIIRASFSQERMQYLAEPSKVVYRAKGGTEEKVFDALEWLAAMCSHSRTGGNKWSGTMATTVMSPGESEKEPKTTGFPASRRVESSTWERIKARRNTGRTGPG
jgi:hypothetical protein